MLPYTHTAVAVLLALSQIAHPFVLLTANIEDVKKIARKFVSESLANQIAQYIARAGNSVTTNVSVENEQNAGENQEFSDNDLEVFHKAARQENVFKRPNTIAKNSRTTKQRTKHTTEYIDYPTEFEKPYNRPNYENKKSDWMPQRQEWDTKYTFKETIKSGQDKENHRKIKRNWQQYHEAKRKSKQDNWEDHIQKITIKKQRQNFKKKTTEQERETPHQEYYDTEVKHKKQDRFKIENRQKPRQQNKVINQHMQSNSDAHKSEAKTYSITETKDYGRVEYETERNRPFNEINRYISTIHSAAGYDESQDEDRPVAKTRQRPKDRPKGRYASLSNTETTTEKPDPTKVLEFSSRFEQGFNIARAATELTTRREKSEFDQYVMPYRYPEQQFYNRAELIATSGNVELTKVTTDATDGERSAEKR